MQTMKTRAESIQIWFVTMQKRKEGKKDGRKKNGKKKEGRKERKRETPSASIDCEGLLEV